jgi:hypothetical protein
VPDRHDFTRADKSSSRFQRDTMAIPEMDKKGRWNSFLAFFVDLALFYVSFTIVNALSSPHPRLRSPYLKWQILCFIWLVISWGTKRSVLGTQRQYAKGIIAILKSVIYLFLAMSSLIVGFGLRAFPILYVLGLCVLLLLFETGLYSLYYRMTRNGGRKAALTTGVGRHDTRGGDVSTLLISCDLIFILMAFFVTHLLNSGTFVLTHEHQDMLLLFYGLWFFSSGITRKYYLNNFQNYAYAMAASIKSVILTLSALSVIILTLRIVLYSRFLIFGTFMLFLMFEAAVYGLYFLLNNNRREGLDAGLVPGVRDLIEQKYLDVEDRGNKERATSFMRILTEGSLKSYPQLSEFIKESLHLAKLDFTRVLVLDSDNVPDFATQRGKRLKLVVNFRALNDVRWLNRYFLEVYKKLANGGYYIGRVETIDIHKRKFFLRYPKYYGEIFYIFYFVLNRVFPKLAKIRTLYFALTRGKLRSLSRAEVLGRLCYCGFDIMDDREIEGSHFIIAQKRRAPCLDESPSYGPIIRLKRIGLNGQVINVYKFRTMYVYSEYLQEHIMERQKLEAGGKIKDDYRVTEWGKLMRKYWLDEIPMVYNWIRGEVKFFGVRPLSIHYYKLYSERFRQVRMKTKPGLVPPIYADLPRQFNEIEDSEREYIRRYFERPLRTQVHYFLKVFGNIVFKNARSG